MLNFKSGTNDSSPTMFGYTARTRVKIVVNKKRAVVRVPPLLHLMSIFSQRRWCRRNSVEFINPARILVKRVVVDNAA